MKAILILSLFATVALASVEDYPPKGYFTSDVTKLTWAHGVNSQAQMEASLGDDSIQMLEADIVMGTVPGSNVRVPIMAHPPANTSDLRLYDFIEGVIAHNKDLNLTERKGIKLDFKDQDAALLGLQNLRAKSLQDPDQLQFPIWINSDVLQGPVGASPPGVDGKVLIAAQKERFPPTTLSLGWTTRFVEGGNYSKEQLDEMAALLNETESTAFITFPLRAQFALKSAEDIKALLDDPRLEAMSPSVTLWEGESDPRVTDAELNEFIEKLGENRVFVDLPHSFGEGGGSTEWPTSTDNGVGGNAAICKFIMCGLALLSFVFLSN